MNSYIVQGFIKEAGVFDSLFNFLYGKKPVLVHTPATIQPATLNQATFTPATQLTVGEIPEYVTLQNAVNALTKKPKGELTPILETFSKTNLPQGQFTPATMTPAVLHQGTASMVGGPNIYQNIARYISYLTGIGGLSYLGGNLARPSGMSDAEHKQMLKLLKQNKELETSLQASKNTVFNKIKDSDLSKYIQDNPWKSVGIAAALAALGYGSTKL